MLWDIVMDGLLKYLNDLEEVKGTMPYADDPTIVLETTSGILYKWKQKEFWWSWMRVKKKMGLAANKLKMVLM